MTPNPFDPDAYLQQAPSTPAFDPDAHLANAVPVSASPAETRVPSVPDPEHLEHEFGEDLGAQPLVSSGDFLRGLARGAIRTFTSATAGNQAAAERDVQNLSGKFGIAKGTGTPQGIAGETVGGFLAPLPGGPTQSAATSVVDPVDALVSKVRTGSNTSVGNALDAIREQVGPDVTTTHPVDHGDTLIQAYKDKDAPVVADITAKYKALEDANGGQFPLDTKAFVTSTDEALSKALKTNALPADLAASLKEFRGGRQMTFEDFESLRSDAADAMRTATDGRQRAAASIVRDQLENMPLTPEAQELKPLADAARSAAKERFDALEADPAYKAAVNDTVPPDRFVQKFITGPTATRDGVAQMKENLSDNPVATQTMGVAALDHLRNSSGIDVGSDFRQGAFNKQLDFLGPRLKSLVDPKTLDQLESVGNAPGHGLVRKAVAAVTPTVATGIGAHVLGAPGAMAARYIGQRLAEKVQPP